MTPQRRDQLLQGVSSSARKLYELVPISESWPMHKIEAEGARKNQIMSRAFAFKMIMDLADAGLVRVEGERNASMFCRVRVSEEKQKPQAKKDDSMKENKAGLPAPKVKQTPTQMFAAVAKRAREVARQIELLAEEIEIAAMEVEESAAESSAEYDKLKQMKDLLKSMVGS